MPATKLAFGWLRLSRCQSCGPISGRGCGSKGLGYQGSPQPQPGLRGPCSQTWELMLHTVEVSIHDLSPRGAKPGTQPCREDYFILPNSRAWASSSPLCHLSSPGLPRPGFKQSKTVGRGSSHVWRHNTFVATGDKDLEQPKEDEGLWAPLRATGPCAPLECTPKGLDAAHAPSWEGMEGGKPMCMLQSTQGTRGQP